jgi:hypothetical protein
MNITLQTIYGKNQAQISTPLNVKPEKSSHIKMQPKSNCHCEERSDEAIQKSLYFGLPCSRWSLAMTEKSDVPTADRYHVHKEVSFGLLEHLSWLSLSNITGIKFHNSDNTLEKLNDYHTQLEEILSADSLPQDPESRKKIEKTISETYLAVDNLIYPERKNKLREINLENIKRENLVALKDSLKAVIEASNYHPEEFDLGGGKKISVHNKAVLAYLKPSYTKEQFENLFKLCKDNGTFQLKIDEATGFAKTNGSKKEESPDMDRCWVTDTVRSGVIEREQAPDKWKKALQKLAEFYNQPIERVSIQSIILSPDVYNKTPDVIVGVAHVFKIENNEFVRDDEWFNNERMESHGLALKALCDNILEGLVPDKSGKAKDWGFKPEDIDENTISTIVALAHFFKAIDYPTACTSGNWEEIPFHKGLTWDTEAVRSSYESLNTLLFDKSLDNNENIQKLRERLRTQEKEYLKSLEIENSAFFDKPSEVNDLIKKGENRVRNNYLAEAPGIREKDSSLAFITTSTIKLDDDPLNDIKKHVEILATLEDSLVRENGIIRYEPVTVKNKSKSYICPDSYLHPNWELALNKSRKPRKKIESKDVSDFNKFVARSKSVKPGQEAQWFMVSAMAEGYGRQLSKLLDIIEISKRAPSDEEKKLIRELYNKEAEYINRSYARLTGKEQIKSNGKESPSFAAPEAFQGVTALDKNGKTKLVYLPGMHTPLTWAASSLYSASVVMAENLNRLEKLDKPLIENMKI